MNAKLAGIALAISISVPVSASAGESTVEVRYADLDLTTTDGRETLDARLNGAVRRICGRRRAPTLDEQVAVRNCREDVLARVSADRERLIAEAEARKSARVLARADIAPR